jgi:hypothetical protein
VRSSSLIFDRVTLGVAVAVVESPSPELVEHAGSIELNMRYPDFTPLTAGTICLLVLSEDIQFPQAPTKSRSEGHLCRLAPKLIGSYAGRNNDGKGERELAVSWRTTVLLSHSGPLLRDLTRYCIVILDHVCKTTAQFQIVHGKESAF